MTTVTLAWWGLTIAPHQAREWRAVLCPDHTAWACSGLGVEFLPLKLPGGCRSECEKKAEGGMEEVTQSK